MSNRTLIEINHDTAAFNINGDGDAFIGALTSYLASGSPENAERLKRYGIRVFGMRHHSEAFRITWGCHKADESETRR